MGHISDKRYTPAEHFADYFALAKSNYEFTHGVEKATQKAFLEWYNKKYNTALSEASLSKYLRGTNAIPLDVYVHMKELAGVEDLFRGMGASREDFEISSDFQESMNFVSEEIEYMCGLEELEGTVGESIKEMMKTLERYCECASRKDYQSEMRALQELKDIIYESESKIRIEFDKKCYADLPLCDYCYDDIDDDWHTDSHSANKINTQNNSMADLNLLTLCSEKCKNLASIVDRCMVLLGSLSTEEAYMDIPVKRENKTVQDIDAFGIWQ